MNTVQRCGESSYQMVDNEGVFHDAHVDQIKPFVADEMGECLETLHYQKSGILTPMVETHEMEKITRHRRGDSGAWELLTHSKGQPETEDIWEPLETFVKRELLELLAHYCAQQELTLSLADILQKGDMAL